jgi:hypothetical protein
MPANDRPYADPNHPGNQLRPNVRCVGCGKDGCVTAWGPWCFECNVERLDRISAPFAKAGAALDP